jgi:lysylphosphatidylglycerol synthetase-like protein (DUF2156 family)
MASSTQAVGVVPAGRAGNRSWATALGYARRMPFTLTVVGVMLVLGFATYAFWQPLDESVWWNRVAFGLPAFDDNRWWTPVTGPFFAQDPATYLAVLLLCGILFGFAELRLGTRVTAFWSIVTQLVGVFATAGMLNALKHSHWHWAEHEAAQLDVGFSVGAMAIFVVYAFTLSAPWRGRLLFGALGYCVIGLLYIGDISDIEHAFGAILGIIVGWRLGHMRRHRGRLTRHEVRIITTIGFVLVSIGQLVGMFSPGTGPLGPSHVTTQRPLMIVFVVFQLIVCKGLVRGNVLAWRVAVVLAFFGILVSLGLRPPGRLVVGMLVYVPLVVLLIRGRRAYTARIVPLNQARFARDAAIVLLAYAAYVFLGFSAIDSFRPVPSSTDALAEFGARLILSTSGRFAGTSPGARVFLDSLSWLLPLVLVTLLLVYAARARAPAATSGPGQIIALIKKHGGSDLAWMTTWSGNLYFFTRDGEGAVAYQVHSGTAITLGDPVCAPEAVGDVVTEFARHCEREGWIPCMFSVTGKVVGHLGRVRWDHVQVAEDTLIDLPELEFKGKSFQDIRTAINRAAKSEIQFRMVRLQDESFRTVRQVRGICEEWVSGKAMPEMGFTLGSVDEALDPEVRVGLAEDEDGKVHGITSWLPAYGPGGTITGWTLDVMRRHPEGFRPVIEFMIASACLHFKDEGAHFVSLSGAPLARSDPEERLSGIDNLLELLGRALEPFYGFRSLHQFKAKFKPRNEPMYMTFPDEAALPRIGLALTHAYLPDARLRDFATMLVSSR